MRLGGKRSEEGRLWSHHIRGEQSNKGGPFLCEGVGFFRHHGYHFSPLNNTVFRGYNIGTLTRYSLKAWNSEMCVRPCQLSMMEFSCRQKKSYHVSQSLKYTSGTIKDAVSKQQMNSTIWCFHKKDKTWYRFSILKKMPITLGNWKSTHEPIW